MMAVKKRWKKLKAFNWGKKEELRALYHFKRNFMKERIGLFCVTEIGGS